VAFRKQVPVQRPLGKAPFLVLHHPRQFANSVVAVCLGTQVVDVSRALRALPIHEASVSRRRGVVQQTSGALCHWQLSGAPPVR
jgi:hypothetical protein